MARRFDFMRLPRDVRSPGPEISAFALGAQAVSSRKAVHNPDLPECCHVAMDSKLSMTPTFEDVTSAI